MSRAGRGVFLLQYLRIFPLITFAAIFTFASPSPVPLTIKPSSATADPSIYTNGEVRAMFLSDSVLYIGGTFSEVHDAMGSISRRGLASFDLRSKRFTSFKADVERGTIRTITVGYGRVFAGGQFTSVNNVRCNNLVALDPKSGKVQMDFATKDIQPDGPVFATVCTDSVLFIGGNFKNIGSDSAHYLAAIDICTRKPVPRFDLNPDDSMDIDGKMVGGVWTLAVHPIDSSILFAGGNFQRVNRVDNGRGLFAFRSDGSPGPVFLDAIVDPAVSITCKGTSLYAGMGGISNRVDAYDISSREEIGRRWKGYTAEGDVQAVTCSEDGYVYFSFHQGLFDTTDFYRCAVLHAGSGNLYDTIPSMNSFFGVWSLLSTEATLFAGGSFTRFNGKRQNNFAKIEVREYPLPFPPGQVHLKKPMDNADDIAEYSRLSWSFTAFAETYELQMSKNRAFDLVEREFTALTTLDKRIAGIEPGTTYYWKVRAKNSSGVGPWSSSRSFTSAFDTRRSPAIIFPQQDFVYDPLSVVCTWNSLLDALAYDIEISEDAGFVTKLFAKAGINDTSIAVEKLTYDASYHLRVRAVFPSASSDWSVASFLTTPAIVEHSPPELIQPRDGSREVSCLVDFVWRNSETSSSVNIVQVSKDSLCNELIVDTLINNGTTFCHMFNGSESKYYWRVAQVVSHENKWSPVSSFLTVNCMCTAPLDLQPVTESTIYIDSITLEWKGPQNAASVYRIEIDTSINMVTPIIVATITDTLYRLNNLSDSTGYFWRVKVVPPVGSGSYSGIQKFSTIFQKLPPSPVPKNVPDRFRVHNAYIAGALCNVRIDVAEQTTVYLSIYDYSGRRIGVQTYNDLTPENYLLSFPLRSIVKGHFIMTVDAGLFHKSISILKME